MQTTRWAATLCALTILPVFGPAAWAQQSPPDGSAGKSPSAKYDASWPVVLTPNPKDSNSGQPLPAWSQQDVEDGRVRCAELLKGLDLVAVPADPIREGEACGSPAPMKLVSIGSNPPIAFSAPPMLTCDMIVALHKWLQGDVQRLARKHLGAPIVGIRVMSAYSCRNAYGRAKARLSEHGRVNALDLGEFLTARGETAQVVADWGPIARAITAKATTGGRAEAIKRQAEAAAAARKSKASEEPRMAAPSGPRILQGSTVQVGIPGLTRPSDTETGFGWAPPSRLGGPKEADTASTAALDGKSAFLRGIHKAACAIFSTVLGPEANKAHRNHFHLDMARRTSGHICE